jgi:hypothetical protein
VGVVAPVFQVYELAPLAVRVVEVPGQRVAVLGDIEIVIELTMGTLTV